MSDGPNHPVRAATPGPGTLAGKVALVTGAGRGIGEAVARRLAADGAAVVVNDIDADAAAAVVDALTRAGGRAHAVDGDVTAAGFAERMVADACEAFGVPDILVPCAGYTWDRTVGNLTDEQMDAMLDVHLKAPVRLIRALAEPWKAAAKAEGEHGRARCRKVVTISSIAGLYGNPGQVAYGSAKAALVGLTRTMAKEWGRYNVTVNCVAFGLIETRLTTPIVSGAQATILVGEREVKIGVQPEQLETMEALIPLGRQGTVQEAAGAIAFLCGPDSDYVSGQVLVVGGGLLL